VTAFALARPFEVVLAAAVAPHADRLVIRQVSLRLAKT